jgi:hypothetical protein
MSFLSNLLLGNGTIKPKLRAALESEGLVLIEEGLPGSVRYRHFKAPGKRFNGKVTGERLGLAISEERFVVYCRSGRGKLIDTPYSDPRLGMLDVELQDEDRAVIHIDFDRGDVPKVSGQMAIHAKTAKAPEIVEELRTRLGRA